MIDTTSEFQNIALGVQNANIVNANFTVSKPGAIIDFANVNVSNSFIRVFYEINNKVFTIHRSGDFLTYVNIVVIAEYTKTTD